MFNFLFNYLSEMELNMQLHSRKTLNIVVPPLEVAWMPFIGIINKQTQSQRWSGPQLTDGQLTQA